MKKPYLIFFALALNIILCSAGCFADSGQEQELIDAAFSNDFQKVNELISQGVDVNAMFDMTGDTPLTAAADKGNTEMVRLLISKGADLEAWSLGGTALMRAANEGRAEVVKLLIESGADVNAMTRGGESALSLAEKNGHADVVQLLRQAGAR